VEPAVNRSPHLLPWVESISVLVLLFCLVCIAALMGWIPTSFVSPGDNTAAARLSAAPKDPVGPKTHTTPASVAESVSMRARCDDCGDLITPIRMIAGPIAGAPGPVGGAVGNAVVGNEIEKRVSSSKNYETTVRFDDGSTPVFGVSGETTPPQWRAGHRMNQSH